jgi:azurin
MSSRLFTFVLFVCFVGQSHAADLFDKSNLAAWCIVPFDAKKRGPEERAAMLEKMGVRKFVYDYRAEHIAQWDDELNALKKHHIELMGWWFPTSLNDEAKKTLELFKRHRVHPQLWVNGNGGPIEVKDAADQKARIDKEVAHLKPICEAAAPVGCKVALYNHGSWYGEPENAIAIVETLKAQGIENIGMVYNLHHGHGHLDRLAKVLPKMLPHLLCFNLNGMDIDGEAKGRKILPLGVGTEDVKVLRIVRASGYSGPIGILNHTNEDAEGRLLDNLDGLAWLVPQLDDNPPGAKPQYRTWSDKPAAAAPTITAKLLVVGQGVPSLSKEFGEALKGCYFQLDNESFRTLPLTIECRAKLNGKERFNILIASDAKSSATHWELYTHAKRGTLALYLPGRGGDYDSQVNICDGEWHDLLASIDDKNVVLWIDGKQVFEKAVQPLQGTPKAGGIAFGSLVDHSIGCDGLIDDVRISRGVMKPRKGGAPRLRMDNTLGLWDFDDLGQLLPTPAPAPAAFTPDRKPLRTEDNMHWQEFVNRERIFDYYAKQAEQFMKQTMPELIPAFPGLDGGQQGHWGNQNDQVTWKDNRFAASDHGSVFSTVFKGASLTIPKAVCVRFDDKSAVFNPETLSFPLVWNGGFVKLGENRHGFMGGGTMEGKVISKNELKLDGAYHGFYRHGAEVIFSFSNQSGDHLVTARDHGKDLTPLTKGGPAQWPKWIETKGSLGTQAPFATDTIAVPFENPYGTLFFIAACDFFADGSAAISTMTGEVWLVKGIDDKLDKVSWKRFATGLHQPLGMKIIDGRIHVLGRDQITRLHDLNGDDEADFYECVTNVMQTSPGGHDFIVGLETDAQGRFYFASGNQGVCRITGRDQLDVLATGFRNPDGLGLSPDGRFITTSVQEGDWTPATSICQIELGKNEGAHFGAGGPKNGQPPEPVLLYLPRGEDNSASGQTFITSKKWAALKGDGNLIHLSSGSGSAWLVMRQNVNGRWQAAAVKISGNFDSGPQCARFNAKDGHLYVTGMQGWGSYTPKDGCFQRVRFTGGDKPVPVGFEAHDNGVIIRFNQPVKDADAATCFAQCWNYRYSAAYGSPEYSVKYADTPGHDPLEVRSVQKLDGGKTLFLEIPQIITASQIHLRVSTGHDIFLTAHALAEPFADFPGYTKIAKTNHAAQIGLTAPAPSKPNPWAKGEGGRELVIEAALGLQFVQKQLTAKAGEKLSIVFKNPDVVPHNWLLAKPGSLQKLGDKCNLMITDPQGLAKHYVPDSKDVLVYTDMTNPKESFTIHFTAPQEKGDYPYLCTFPGHWMVMNGVLKVE